MIKILNSCPKTVICDKLAILKTSLKFTINWRICNRSVKCVKIISIYIIVSASHEFINSFQNFQPINEITKKPVSEIQ